MASMKSDTAVEALSALAYAGRLSIFRLLVRAGSEGVAAGEIGRKLGVAPSTLSASLSVLSNAGLIKSRREGRSISMSPITCKCGSFSNISLTTAATANRQFAVR